MLGAVRVVGWSGGALVLLILLSAGRGFSGAHGYARATIEHSARQVEQQLPTGVRDRKLANDLEEFREEIVQRRAKLNLAAAEQTRLQQLTVELESAIERRSVLLRDAAVAAEPVPEGKGTVLFAGREWSGTQFADELERLTGEQEREQRRLEEQRDALVELEGVLAEGRAVVGEMEDLLRQSESEWQSLQLRREQAGSRRQLLDLVESAGRTGGSAAAEIGRHLEGLRSEVAEAEATNAARGNLRDGQESELSRVARHQDLLERLRRDSADAPVAGL
jgi:DNA repair exonuclease SbcCD ATPase subunit